MRNLVILLGLAFVACAGVEEHPFEPPVETLEPEALPPEGGQSPRPSVEPEAERMNQAPKMEALGQHDLQPGERLDVTPVATDPDGDSLVYALEGDAPGGLRFDRATGALSWRARETDAGQSVRLGIGATDGELWVIQPIEIRVAPAEGDAPPRIVEAGEASTRVGVEILLRPVVEDERPQSLRFSPKPGWPRGAAIETHGGALRWTPQPEHADTAWTLGFEVSDGRMSAHGEFHVVVEGLEAEGPEEPPEEQPPEEMPPEEQPPEEMPPAEPPEEAPPAEPPEEMPPPAEEGFGHPAGPALELDWAPNAAGNHHVWVVADGDLTRVEYRVLGAWAAASEGGPDFQVELRLPEGESVRVEAEGYDAEGRLISRGLAIFDVGPNHALFVRQVGVDTYEIGLRNAPPGVAAVEVRADGISLVDGSSGQRRSARLAVRSFFFQLGLRRFEVDTFEADGRLRGTLRREVVLR